jgi:hypothetical protein
MFFCFFGFAGRARERSEGAVVAAAVVVARVFFFFLFFFLFFLSLSLHQNTQTATKTTQNQNMASMLERLTGAAAARASPKAAAGQQQPHGGAPTMTAAEPHQPHLLPQIRTVAPAPQTTTSTTSPAAFLPTPPSAYPLSPHQPDPSEPPTSEEELRIWRLEAALTRSGSALSIEAGCKQLLTPDAVFSWPLGRVVGRGAIARYFALMQLLFVDDASVDSVAVGDVATGSPLWREPALGPHPSFSAPRLARRVAMARLTHRLTPRILDALSPLPVPLPETIGGVRAVGGGGGGGFGLQSQQQQQPTSFALPYRGTHPCPLPTTLRPLAAWLRARLTFKVVDNATYVFALPASAAGALSSSAPVAATTTTAPFEQPHHQIQLIRAEIALVSLIYALPFGETVWHGLVEPGLGAAAQVAQAAWRGFLKPVVAPWFLARGYSALGAL